MVPILVFVLVLDAISKKVSNDSGGSRCFIFDKYSKIYWLNVVLCLKPIS